MLKGAMLLLVLIIGAAAAQEEALPDAQSAAAPEAQQAAPAAPAKAKKAKRAKAAKKKVKKGYDYESSKYKAIVPSEQTIYRYDADGNPILPAKKKPAKKLRSEAAEGSAPEGVEGAKFGASEAPGDAACSDESCK